MSRWLDRVDDLLYDGETVATRVDVGAGSIVVTSHRVLAFTPDGEGANYDSVDRPNVAGVERTTSGSVRLLAPAVKALVLGGVLLAAGQVVGLDGLVGGIDLSGTAELGLGGFGRMLGTLLGLLAMLDEILTAVGALALLAGAALVGAYLWTRTDQVVIEVAGDEDLELPADDDADEAIVDRLDRAVRPEPATEATDERETGDDRQAAGRDPLA